MISVLRRLRHIILIAVLVGSDILIGVYGQTLGMNGESGFGTIIITAVIVVVIVELLYRGN